MNPNSPVPQPVDPDDRLASFPLLTALRQRRSRRVAMGVSVPGGPLEYVSRSVPASLSLAEEGALAFAACGITGPSYADWSFGPEHGGNMMAGFVGRTVASGDGIQAVALVVTNDEGTWLIKRPADHAPQELGPVLELGRAGRFAELYERSRVRIKASRSRPPTEPIFNLRCNAWSAHAPGSTSFLPINDLTFLYINGLLEVLGSGTGAFVVDERAQFQPAGLGRFARSRGGHLEDDVRGGRVVTVRHVETMVAEFLSIEQGMMVQSLGLMAEALGLGGFPSFANHEFAWFEAIGFRMQSMPASRFLGAGWLPSLGLRLLGRDVPVPLPVGLEVDGATLLKPFAPPYYPSMRAAVEAVVEAKFGRNGRYSDAAGVSAWKDPAGVLGAVPRPEPAAIEATVAYCEYLFRRYGRFPVYLAPYRTVVVYQAHRPDPAFYERFYRP